MKQDFLMFHKKVAMKNRQTAEQAAARANEFFEGRCTARVTDYGNRVTVELPKLASVEAVGRQVTDVGRFELFLQSVALAARSTGATSRPN